MTCITLFAQPTAMATTQLARAIHHENVPARQYKCNVEHNSPSMSWVVVTDNNGNRKLQIHWAPSEGLLWRYCSGTIRNIPVTRQAYRGCIYAEQKDCQVGKTS